MKIFPPCHSVEVFEKILGSICGNIRDVPKNKIEPSVIKASVILMKKNSGDVTNVGASFLDRLHELFGNGVSLQLISSVLADSENEGRGKLGKAAYLSNWITKFSSLNAKDEATFDVTFQWHESFGLPEAFLIRNHHHSEFYLKSLTFDTIPSHGRVHFVCDSWIYPAGRYRDDRVFFANKAYLPSDMPAPLRWYRERELRSLRGDGSSGELQKWDRVYDYAYYNDLGSPEKGDEYARPVLGGSEAYPYPRRGKTGRRPNPADPSSESRLSRLSLDIYVPRDERFNQIKFSDFIAYALKSLGQVLVPEIESVFDTTINEFDTFEDVLNLYEGGIRLLNEEDARKLRDCMPWELIRELIRSDGERFLKFPLPDVIKENRTAWRTDEEFAREMLAGVNPVVIRRLREFPIRSELDRRVYGDHDSVITADQLEKNMDGLTVEEALKTNKLYVLDHHDAVMPYLARINETTAKIYATRTVLFLQENGTLKPLAIELSLPSNDENDRGAIGKVYTPSNRGIEASIWQLAKAYVAVNDSGYHQLISHWLNTHAVIEPFVIATNRQLSVLHPIHKLLKPHFRDTMHINALGRQILINAGGVLEKTVFPAQYAMEMSSAVYRSWNFAEQGLPEDLVKRGMAIRDDDQPHGLRLVIEDYPFAVDGLEIWAAIEAWVTEYCCFYYNSDEVVRGDDEIQSWWKEVVETGHGDRKGEPWWPEMAARDDLIQICTIIIWVASALHAAVNFGQYPYAGFMPNRPTVSRRFMPEPGTPEYSELEENPDGVFFKTVTAQFQSLLGVSLIEILSRHSTDEIYLGQAENREWTGDAPPRAAFERFGEALVGIEKRIGERNLDRSLKNRSGPVGVAYTLLYPNTSDYSRVGGLTGKGIPNSISI
ncbi:probable linoleate 9S-lipoxygenase 5 [Andrographis paniculata]|uniref:probable linoleate 9S-lipoxygenase 5 n=1 Tax=Andrographis paniculata TaxID=175694 RepID=UPI0021E7C102|nr:probable linoleate 9S-lipoxygenase 5 [Andrographis paniculata]